MADGIAAPRVDVVVWEDVRREAEEVHRLLQALPVTSPLVPELLARGERLAAIGFLCQKLEAATCCGWVH